MTEAEWLVCQDPLAMLEFLRGKVSDRKLRLFAVACVRRLSPLLVPEARAALEVAERVAEGTADSAERKRARETAFHVGWVSFGAHRRGPAKAAVCDALERRAWEAATNAARRSSHIGAMDRLWPHLGDYSNALKVEEVSITGLLRCSFGNPIRPAALNPSWLSWNDGGIHKMAQSIYDDHAFDRLPLLADALEDAGCIDADILSHCRTPGEHVRGCWVVDLLLGKS
jgi:hypothetical protein